MSELLRYDFQIGLFEPAEFLGWIKRTKPEQRHDEFMALPPEEASKVIIAVCCRQYDRVFLPLIDGMNGADKFDILNLEFYKRDVPRDNIYRPQGYRVIHQMVASPSPKMYKDPNYFKAVFKDIDDEQLVALLTTSFGGIWSAQGTILNDCVVNGYEPFEHLANLFAAIGPNVRKRLIEEIDDPRNKIILGRQLSFLAAPKAPKAIQAVRPPLIPNPDEILANGYRRYQLSRGEEPLPLPPQTFNQIAPYSVTFSALMP